MAGGQRWRARAGGEGRWVHALRGRGQLGAARIVSAIPAAEGILDPAYVDALGLRVHRELQRLG